MSEETIVAIATPPGRGGVGIVRLSGSESCAIALKLTKKTQLRPREAAYTLFFTEEGETIDQGLLLYFKAPHSFTGEDVVELQVHGSPIVLDRLVSLAVDFGARLARPGEFSERAFLNDKMDLTQAEAIADLIHASSMTAARLAVRSLQGDFSRKINELNEKLVYLRMYVEAAIDFPEEEIDFLADGKIARMLTEILADLHAVRSQATQGAMMREGLHIVIAGRPNAGKSTLINALAKREVAIVTDIAGTTRDVMREYILLDDLPVHIVDTAGLRASEDKVEMEGIKRAWQEVSRADCVLMVIDLHQQHDATQLSQAIVDKLPPGVPVIKVFNKIDALGMSPDQDDQAVYLSAKSGEGIDLLKKQIKDAVGFQSSEGQFLARRRHLAALDQAKELLLNGQHQLNTARAGELLAEDLRLAHQSLCEITGEFTSDDLLGKIFSSFCIGK
ncbi:tRNA uridine-5-carboxymethylaminomethyl(34) synthesis GTPase MnmE [Legionella spiritensis]|uniref:tRNA modification GTPase MnmE n=1 Tax=Legionella spiritensis TaxID=452 RepID=A0A0W0ZA19_LEGSP|nr:tRNA uridine-5-carboxymethylaminomethyl(34) synthesis GTPase MnmE [Legionella spiritensis]KTD65984.1 tRNA modification GTPase TrmE [Legionella spiritensis]SNV48925.1 GTP binding protein in thiophene and furan oxidation (GTPase) [Legionella spiritensis]